LASTAPLTPEKHADRKRCVPSDGEGCGLPQTPVQLIHESLDVIAARIFFTEGNSPDSHTVIVGNGLDRDAVALALARYAVAFLAGWVQRNATIGNRNRGRRCRAPRRDPAARRSRHRSPGGLNEEQLLNRKRTWRNAWIAEVLTHALLLIRGAHPSVSLVGDVVALLRPHPLPKRQGLDSLAIYEENGAAVVAIGETKASRDRGSDVLTEACDIFDDVDKALYGPDLRDAIDALAEVLPAQLASTGSNDVWRDARCYLPAIVHQVPFDCTSNRPRLRRLQPLKERKRVLLRTSEAKTPLLRGLLMGRGGLEPPTLGLRVPCSTS
jgi:hypothetical protein